MLIDAIAAPLPISNLDTDQLMPKQFLRGITKDGLAAGVLYDMRFDASGALVPSFVLNQPAYQGAGIWLGGFNFGCGSSREHAVWGLQQLGVQAIIASSFAEIFYTNSLNNRLLLVVLPQAEVDGLMQEITEQPGTRLRIDVAQMSVTAPSGKRFPFTLSPRHQRMIIEGLDLIGATLQMNAEISEFEVRHAVAQPWSQVL